MAPSVRSAGTRTIKKQPTLLGYAKVRKSASVRTGRNGVKISIEKVEDLSTTVCEETPEPVNDDRKRKRGIYASEAEESETEEVPVLTIKSKKVKLWVPLSPPSSDHSNSHTHGPTTCLCASRYDRSPSPPPMPQPFIELFDMHKCLVKAFSFHRAHNGRSAPAELNTLMQAVTNLYKKRSIEKQDIQRMLAIYEVEDKTAIPAKATLVCSNSPFKLMTSGVGSNRRDFVEFVGGHLGNDASWSERGMQKVYKCYMEMIFQSGRRDMLSFLHGPESDYPLLAFSIGAQTAARQHKAAELRHHVLGKPAARQSSLEFSNLSLSNPDSPPQAPKAIKARTLSLFDRVKAKAATNAAAPAPSSETVLRRHAIGRMDEVIEIMKMKQRQRLNTMLEPGTYTSCETPLRRVSFGMTELIGIVKGSMNNPMSNDELKTCITILSREAPGFWIRRLDMDGVLCVVLQGNGPVGQEVQKVFKTKENHALDAEFFDYEGTDLNT